MSFWTKEGEVGSSEGDEEEETFGKQFLTGPPRNNGTI